MQPRALLALVSMLQSTTHLVKMNAMPKDPAMPNLPSAASTVRPAPAGVTAQPMQAAPPSSRPPAMVLCL